MSEAHAEAKVHRRLDNAAGIYVTFLIHPQDAEALDGLRIGASVQLAWAEVVNTEVEKIDVPANRAAKGEASDSAPSEALRETKPRRAFRELSLPEQAGIRCEDVRFQNFIKERHNVTSAVYVPDFVRGHCGVLSRASLASDWEAGKKWRALEAEFQSWLLTQKYADVLR